MVNCIEEGIARIVTFKLEKMHNCFF